MRAISFALALGLVACSSPPAMEGDLTLNDPADEGKADSITGKRLQYTVDYFAGWGGGPQWNSAVEMSSLTNASTVRVHGAAQVFQPADTLEVSTVSHQNFGVRDYWIDMVMLVFARRVPADGAKPTFTRLTCGGMNYASEVLVDPAHDEIDLLGYRADKARTFKLADCGLAPDGGNSKLQIALLPVAAYDFGRIDGSYGYKMQAECQLDCPALDMEPEAK